MKTNNFTIALFFFVFILLSNTLTAQNNLPVKKVYFDLSIGGMFGGVSGFNAHSGIGYQFSEYVGVGIGATASTNLNDLSLDSFGGIGVEYRINKNNLFAKLTTGIVTGYDNSSEFDRYDYIGKKDLFTRFAIGYAPRKGFLNFGLVINSAKGTFNYHACDFDGLPDLNCEYKGEASESMVSPQLYFGFKFPRIKKK